jgi:glycosyltransferase involved in cell wall biosynthesis
VLFALPIARIAGTPIVLASQRGDRRLFPRHYRHALRVTDRLCDGIVVNSAYLKRVLVSQFAVPDALIHVCHNGLNTAIFHATGRTRRPELPDRGIVIGTIAVLRPEKSIETLIDAFRDLDGTHTLVVVGDGPCAETLRARAEAAGIANRCVFAASTSDVASWYRSIDVFVLPSTNESFSNSLMEAMACGCTPVASSAGGNSELVRHGTNGLLFETGSVRDLRDKLAILVNDPVLRARLSVAATRTIQEEHTTQRAVAKFEQLYLDLLDRK